MTCQPHATSACLFAVMLALHTAQPAPPLTTSAASDDIVTSRPAGESLTATVRQLITELRDARYRTRSAAQEKLAALGDAAVPLLVPYLNDADGEVARRVADIVGTPRDPALRVAVALQLLATTDPDWMERAVHMLFVDPSAVADEFEKQSRDLTGVRHVVAAPVAERLDAAKKRHALYASRYERLVREKPETAEKERKLNKETDLYDAEAAYWTAYEALLDYQEKTRTQPSSNPAATSQNATRRSSP